MPVCLEKDRTIDQRLALISALRDDRSEIREFLIRLVVLATCETIAIIA